MKKRHITVEMQRELEAIRAAHDGRLIASDVEVFAADPSTALHWYFEWNNEQGARLYRLHQARLLIRATVTMLPNTNEPIRAYVSLLSDRQSGGGYRATAEVMTEEQQREQLVATALAEMEALKRRYGRLKELAAVFAAIAKAAAKKAAQKK